MIELLKGLAEVFKLVVDRGCALLGFLVAYWLDGRAKHTILPATAIEQGTELMTIKQAANYLQVTPRTVGNYIERGVIRALKYGDEYRFLRDELIEDGKKYRELKGETCATFGPLQSGCNPSNQEQNK